MTPLKRATTAEDIATVAALAREIWTDHFTNLIGAAQVDYMLEHMQSVSAITTQAKEGGYEYYLSFVGKEVAGYFALIPNHDRPDAMQLSKLYVRRAARGRGLGRDAIGFAEAQCAERGCTTLWLTVNKHNREAIAFYERLGFTHEASVVLDIGGGFVMDDYRMAKGVAPGFRG